MGGEVRSALRWAVAFCLAAFVGMVLVTAMFALDLDGGIRGAALWVLLAVFTAGLFTAVPDGPRALVRLFRGARND